MSVTPFLPGLPAPVPTDPGAPAAADPGDLGVVFGDALAAALLATVPLPTTPTPAPVVESSPSPVESSLSPIESSLPPVESSDSPVQALLTSLDLSALRGGLPAGSLASPRPAETNAAAVTTPPAEVALARRTTADLPEAPPTATTDLTLDRSGSTEVPDDSTGESGDSTGVSASSTGVSASSTTTKPTVERAVVQQVFPEVTRLVTSTPTDRPGTHRITLTLQPEQLGEVRVTLVVKDGAVQVRLAGNAGDAAGDAAVHRALSSGVPELQRLLERSGATEARVVVRDPFSPTPAQQATAPAAPVAPTSQPGGGTVSADAGREGASAWNRSSGDSDQRRQRRDVPEPPPVAPAPAPTTTNTRAAGQLDRSL